MGNEKQTIQQGNAVLGIELGSTRIKAVLVNEKEQPIAVGSYDWENQLLDGIWTYSLDEVWNGIQTAYKKLSEQVMKEYQTEITSLKAIGFSAMMHGYMVFDKDEKQLVPFRTWRNTMTSEASEILTETFQFHIPQRWSIAHLYQAILNKEPHLKEISFMTTLAGYVHWKLTGEKVIGIGDASGMFPIDPKTKDYNETMLDKFDTLNVKENLGWKIKDLLPKVLLAGDAAGTLTEEGAKLLDVTGKLKAGVTLCPPEGDAGTGMVATNSVAVKTGNISAGTSVFAMIVLEKELKKLHEELDIVTTPVGHDVAMVHCNNCTSDLNAWVNLFKEFSESFGIKADMNELYGTLYRKALEADPDCGGLLSYNYFSGEHITGLNEGRPLFVRKPDSSFTLANFMRVQLYTALGALKVGLDILLKEEGVKIDEIYGHGGLFKTKEVGQKMVAAAINTPVTVMETAGEGGAWGIAVLASYCMNKKEHESLSDFLNNRVFVGEGKVTVQPEAKDVEGFNSFIKRYTNGLAIEKAAVKYM